MKGRYLYQYCARFQDKYDKLVFIDGIAQMEARITNQEQYQRLKPLIDKDNHHKMTISSLSYLGREGDQ